MRMQLLNSAENLSKDHFMYLHYHTPYLYIEPFTKITTKGKELNCVGEDSMENKRFFFLLL